MEIKERIGGIYFLGINKFWLKIIPLMAINRDFVRFIIMFPTKKSQGLTDVSPFFVLKSNWLRLRSTILDNFGIYWLAVY